MYAIEIHWLVYTFPWWQLEQQGGCVPLMWPAVLCSGLAALSCELGRNPPTLKNKKHTTVLTQIKRMIQCSARNSILGIYGWIQLSASRH